MPKRRLVARFVVWAEAIVLMGLGIGLLTARTVTVWQPVDGAAESYAGHPVDVSGVGLALLVVGLVIFATLLILEGYFRNSTER